MFSLKYLYASRFLDTWDKQTGKKNNMITVYLK